jgi:hypothetical protein
MKSFGGEQPYRIEWNSESEVIAPFTQTTTWELPCVKVGGERSRGGGSNRHGRRASHPVPRRRREARRRARRQSRRGLRRRRARQDRLRAARLGSGRAADGAGRAGGDHGSGATRHRDGAPAPVPCHGRLPGQALPSAPALEPSSPERSRDPVRACGEPLILATGSLGDHERLSFIVDSGLEDEGGASVALPRATLDLLGIPAPSLTEEVGESGAGRLSLRAAAGGTRAARPAQRIGPVRSLPRPVDRGGRGLRPRDPQPRLPAPLRVDARLRAHEDDIRAARCLTGATRTHG